MLQNTLTRILLLSSLCSLAACGGGGLSSTGGTIDPGAGGNNGGNNGGDLFAMADLDGDWTGELLPTLATRGDRNLFLRMLDGALIDAAEGGGGAWDAGNATLALTFAADGFLDLLLDSPASGSLHLEGYMHVEMTTISGSFTMDEPARDPYVGLFELRLSSGASSFPSNLAAGQWTGEVLNSSDRFRLSLLEIDIDGNLVRAALTKPANSVAVHKYESLGNELAFSLSDEKIGLFNPILLTALDGSTLTFDYLLINDDGTLMSGPGVDSVLGSGHVELSRPVVE